MSDSPLPPSDSHDENTRHVADLFDETSHDPFATRQPVEGTPYRDPKEALAARRRELEAELRALREREREVRRARLPRLSGLMKLGLVAAAIGALLGAGVGIGIVVAQATGRVELDPHAERLHHRTIVRAIRAARREEAREERARADVRRAIAEHMAPAPAASGACDGDALERHVTPVSDAVWDVDSCAVDGAPIAAAGRFVPFSESGRVTGLRVYGVRPGSLLDHLGITNGDVLVGVNGHPVAEDPLAAYASADGASRIVIDFVRRGEPRTHTYLVRDAAGT
jgi:hypothetical protein